MKNVDCEAGREITNLILDRRITKEIITNRNFSFGFTSPRRKWFLVIRIIARNDLTIINEARNMREKNSLKNAIIRDKRTGMFEYIITDFEMIFGKSSAISYDISLVEYTVRMKSDSRIASFYEFCKIK